MWYKLEYNLILAAISAFIRVYLRFQTRTNPHGWLPPSRPDGLRWQGIVQRGGAAGECRCVRTGWELDSILIQATEGTGDTEKWKNALRTQRPLRLQISHKLYILKAHQCPHRTHQYLKPPPASRAPRRWL